MLEKASVFRSVVLIILLLIGSFASTSFAYGAAEIKSQSANVKLDQATYSIPTESEELKISIRIMDSDFNTSPDGVDEISQDLLGAPGVGPVKISIVRGDSVVLGYAGGQSSNDGPLDSKPLEVTPQEISQIRQFGPITETSPTSGIFEFDFSIKNTDGPESSKCPALGAAQNRFDDSNSFSRNCILQGDVILVEYTDPTDVSGSPRTVTASATFSTLNPSQSYGSGSEKITVTKKVRIGHPLTLLLYDNNLNLDSSKAESYTLDLIQFESDNIRTTLGPAGGVQKEFNPQPSALRETGDNTGIFYSVIEVPRTINGQVIEVNEVIEFEYTQRGLGAFLVVQQGTFSHEMTDMIKNSGSTLDNEKITSKQTIDKICKPGFAKIFKHDGSPLCVKPKTAEKLVERGWKRA
jgi:hypothetical protein